MIYDLQFTNYDEEGISRTCLPAGRAAQRRRGPACRQAGFRRGKLEVRKQRIENRILIYDLRFTNWELEVRIPMVIGRKLEVFAGVLLISIVSNFEF